MSVAVHESTAPQKRKAKQPPQGGEHGESHGAFSEHLEAIREINLSYLLLAQKMVLADKAAATYRLGISVDVADIIGKLSPPQLIRIASSSHLLARFRFDDPKIWDRITFTSETLSTPIGAAVGNLHAAILGACIRIED